MKLIILSAVLVGISGRPEFPEIASQYHSQDHLGRYNYGYSAAESSRTESRSLDGTTRGRYSYLDTNGLVQSVEYVADADNGFRVIATNLPVAPSPVQETPEVARARSEHLAAVELAKKDDLESVEVGAPVQYLSNPTPSFISTSYYPPIYSPGFYTALAPVLFHNEHLVPVIAKFTDNQVTDHIKAKTLSETESTASTTSN